MSEQKPNAFENILLYCSCLLFFLSACGPSIREAINAPSGYIPLPSFLIYKNFKHSDDNVALRILRIYDGYAVIELKNCSQENIVVPKSSDYRINAEFFKVTSSLGTYWRDCDMPRLNNKTVEALSLNPGESIIYFYPFRTIDILLLDDTKISFRLEVTDRIKRIIKNKNLIGNKQTPTTESIILSE